MRRTLTAAALAVWPAAGVACFWALGGPGAGSAGPAAPPAAAAAVGDPGRAGPRVAAAGADDPIWGRALRRPLFPPAAAPPPAAPPAPPPRAVPPPAVVLLGTMAEGAGGDAAAALRVGTGPAAAVEVRRAGEALEGLPAVRMEAVGDGEAVVTSGGREFRLATPAPAAAPFADAAD
ncbi:hypothetical protein [Alienimonas sp. DA493]|uniref:hypothetical protein n=1 Tax=Alienimonas sp. DA493 TaxID=3373605 RepID=UPI003754BD27